jgi:hypothetical protein
VRERHGTRPRFSADHVQGVAEKPDKFKVKIK